MPNLKPNQFILDGHTFTERPILYQTEMVKAVMDGSKTKTRRTKGLETRNENPELWTTEGCRTTNMYHFRDFPAKKNPTKLVEFRKTETDQQEERREYWSACPYGNPGDLLWVRETHRIAGGPTTHFYQYFADRSDWIRSPLNRWKPSIHMPKDAARLWLMIEDVRVERVQDISEEDAIAEGVIKGEGFNKGTSLYYDYEAEIYNLQYAKSSFKYLWYVINGRESWKSNPWVWVIQFRVISKTGRPSDAIILDHYKQIAQRAALATSNP